MEIKKSDLFEYFDPDWLLELSHTDQQTVNHVIEPFLMHLPDMLDDIEYAVNQRSASKLKEALTRVIAVASMFTRHNFGSRFTAFMETEGPISAHTLKRLSETLHELNQLKNEVISYQQLELNSQIGIQ